MMLIGLLVVNTVAWLVLHFAISALCFNIPLRYFLKDVAFLLIAPWEKNGEVWNRLLFVKKWKRYLIDGSSIVKKSYDKSRLNGTKQEDLLIFAAETKRAELTHWLLMFPAPLFFLWNPDWAGWIILAYALLANIPFIITQRYNRGRIESIVGSSRYGKGRRRKERKSR